MGLKRQGIVVSFDETRGFGFIRASGNSEDVFVHQSVVEGSDPLRPGQRVRFESEVTERGPRAVRVAPGSVGLSPVMGSVVTLFGAVLVATLSLKLAGMPWVLAWLVPMNVATLGVWTWDKHRAVRNGRRVPETFLIGLTVMGGTLGGLIGMGMLGHKRRKPRFLATVGVVALLQMSIALIVLVRS